MIIFYKATLEMDVKSQKPKRTQNNEHPPDATLL